MADIEKNCESCGAYIHESYPHYVLSNGCWLCSDCSLLQGHISKEEYIDNVMYSIIVPKNTKWVEIIDGKIIAGVGKKPWEISTRDRKESGYQKWRTQVFVRDNFTCQICKKVGGELNAHHIKPYSKYIEERTNVDNGITLCVECHRMVHKTKNKKYIKGT